MVGKGRDMYRIRSGEYTSSHALEKLLLAKSIPWHMRQWDTEGQCKLWIYFPLSFNS